MNPRYFQEFLGKRVGSLKGDKSSGGGLKEPCNLEK